MKRLEWTTLHFARIALYKAVDEGAAHRRNFMGYTSGKPSWVEIGLGMSSISDSWYGFAQNVKTVEGYEQLVSQGEIPIFRGHVLSEEDLIIRKHISTS